VAGKGGGAWKVAYADFVTAMMAFFLVMWLCSQDQKTRESVAKYFSDPTGHSKKPGKTGGIFDASGKGNIPMADGVTFGRGRDTHGARGEKSPATKLVSDWMLTDKSMNKYWQAQAQRQVTSAQTNREPDERDDSVTTVAARRLSAQLRDEITAGIPQQAKGFYRDLLMDSIAEVNWQQIAEDLLAN
jgi:flagellar motor protein MotB